MIGYKVVYDRFGDGRYLTSCTIQNELEQVYEPKIMVEAKVGGFLLFEGLKDAHQFLKKQYYGPCVNLFPIWKCYAQEQVALPRCQLLTNNVELIERLWASGLREDVHAWPWPPGTVAYKRVMLLEKVK